MNQAGWIREAFFGAYIVTLGIAAVIRAIFSWRDRTLFTMGGVLQLFTVACATLLGPIYGSRTAAALIDDDLVGHPSAHVYIRELLLILGASGAYLYVGWIRRRPLQDAFVVGVAVAIAAWLTVTYIHVTAHGHGFGIRLAHYRHDVAVYYLLFYGYVTLAAVRLATLGARVLPLLDPNEEAVAVGIRAIVVAATSSLLLPATHLTALALLVVGSGAGSEPLLVIGTAGYVLANVAYVLGVTYPRPAVAWARRRNKRVASTGS